MAVQGKFTGSMNLDRHSHGFFGRGLAAGLFYVPRAHMPSRRIRAMLASMTDSSSDNHGGDGWGIWLGRQLMARDAGGLCRSEHKLRNEPKAKSAKAL
jgi:hypothetical protein